MNTVYSKNLTSYNRRITREITFGGIPMGGAHPIRIQSMTNTPTTDTDSTVTQIENIAAEGADYVRLAVQGKKEVENLSTIAAELSKRGCNIPLIADIHFNPKLALMAASIVDKVRINPGNYLDKKLSGSHEYTEETYQADLRRLREQLVELLDVCQSNNTALRIGTNHGSLSDRIMSRYGDTPEGMAESAMEFLRICKDLEFHNVVVSMKASNTRIMVYATRLLVCKMEEEGMSYPVHLGVTEAGEGEDGRIKSAVGMGALLADGIGETIRVSLTEDPEIEIPVARKIVNYLSLRSHHKPIIPFGPYPIDPYKYQKRRSSITGNIGGKNVPVVIHTINGDIEKEKIIRIGWNHTNEKGWQFSDLAPDYLVVNHWPHELPLLNAKKLIVPFDKYTAGPGFAGCILSFEQFIKHKDSLKGIRFVKMLTSQLNNKAIESFTHADQVVLLLETDNANGYADQRAAIFRLMNKQCNIPVILKRKYDETLAEDIQIKAAMDLGGLFIDGVGDGILLENSGAVDDSTLVTTSFGILQASRVRISKTEFISCPSCGRTLFDLQSTTKKIRERTSHLKGLKIGIMGCIVNGPGEMADADYGYVGAGIGQVTLYKEKTVVRKNVPENEAVEALVALIKENNDWIDPESV